MFKSFKINGCKHYELMAEVFARSVATGGLAKSSSQMAPNSYEEHIDEDEFLYSARPSSTTIEDCTSSKGKQSLDDMMDIGGSTRKSTNKRWKEHMAHAIHTVSASITSKEERRKAREDGSTMSTAAANPYNMTTSIEILKNMSGIPQSAINAVIICIVAACLLMDEVERTPCRTSTLSGNDYINEVLYGNPARCYDSFRMVPSVFGKLCDRLKGLGALKDIRHVPVEEQLVMDLLALTHKSAQRIIAERFQHYTRTIHKCVKSVIRALVRLGNDIIKK